MLRQQVAEEEAAAEAAAALTGGGGGSGAGSSAATEVDESEMAGAEEGGAGELTPVKRAWSPSVSLTAARTNALTTATPPNKKMGERSSMRKRKAGADFGSPPARTSGRRGRSADAAAAIADADADGASSIADAPPSSSAPTAREAGWIGGGRDRPPPHPRPTRPSPHHRPRTPECRRRAAAPRPVEKFPGPARAAGGAAPSPRTIPSTLPRDGWRYGRLLMLEGEVRYDESSLKGAQARRQASADGEGRRGVEGEGVGGARSAGGGGGGAGGGRGLGQPPARRRRRRSRARPG